MSVRSLIMRGLLFLTPLWLTVTLVAFAASLADRWLGGITDALVHLIFPSSWITAISSDGHIPGLSLVTLLVVLAATGFIASWPVGAKGLRIIDHLFLAIPGVNKLYSAFRKIIDTLGEPGQSRFQKVVMCNYAGVKILGFVTGISTAVEGGRRHCFVFVPTPPNPTSGFLLVVPEDETIELAISQEDAIKMFISLGVLAPRTLPIKD